MWWSSWLDHLAPTVKVVEVGCLNHQAACLPTSQGPGERWWLYTIEAEWYPCAWGWHNPGGCILCIGGGGCWCPHGNSRPVSTQEASIAARLYRGALRCQVACPVRTRQMAVALKHTPGLRAREKSLPLGYEAYGKCSHLAAFPGGALSPPHPRLEGYVLGSFWGRSLYS